MTTDSANSHPPSYATILCVDDEALGLKVRAKLLETAGFRVLTATDGPSALELFESTDVDLVLLDYMMPRMHGGEVASAMRRLRPATLIVMLSAYISLPPEVTGSVDLCLVKGLAPRDLISTINSALQKRSQEREDR